MYMQVDLHHVNGPVVVHCQTGIGRTAMLICIGLSVCVI